MHAGKHFLKTFEKAYLIIQFIVTEKRNKNSPIMHNLLKILQHNVDIELNCFGCFYILNYTHTFKVHLQVTDPK